SINFNDASMVTNQPVMTGTDGGVSTAYNCADLTSSTGTMRVGFASAVALAFSSGNSLGCSGQAPIYCFQIDHVAASVAPTPVAGRRIFASNQIMSGAGLAGLDG